MQEHFNSNKIQLLIEHKIDYAREWKSKNSEPKVKKRKKRKKREAHGMVHELL